MKRLSEAVWGGLGWMIVRMSLDGLPNREAVLGIILGLLYFTMAGLLIHRHVREEQPETVAA